MKLFSDKQERELAALAQGFEQHWGRTDDMSFQDDVEARYKFCKEKANCLPPAEAEWYIAYAELAFLRSAMLKAKEDKEAMIRAAVSAAVEVACANAKGGTHEEPKDDE